MALDTYSNLKLSIASWLHRSDLTSQLDDFIALAEEMIWKDLRVKEMEDNDAVSITTSSRYVSLPTGTLEVKRVYLNANPIVHLKPMTTSQIDENYNSTAGKPKYYAVLGTQLEFERVPDSTYDLYVNYYKKLTGLSGSNATNDVLTYYPSVYLYGCCLAGAIYIEDNDKIAKFKPLYEAAVAGANAQTKRGRFGAGAMVRAA